MSTLIKNATLYDHRSPYHLKKISILIASGKITKISDNINDAKVKKTISGKNLCVSPGWLDIGAFNGEPGYEQREDLNTLKTAAAKGGYVYLAPLPNATPAVDNKSQIQYLQRRNEEHATEIIPVACATAGANGEDIAELIDLSTAGAVAFTDGPNSRISKGQMLRILEYLKSIDGCYIHHIPQNSLSLDGQMNEGEISIQLGLSGIPKVEEHIAISEALKIASYANSSIRIHNISTSEPIKEVKRSSQEVFLSVPFLNLIEDEKGLSEFNTNLKVLPPLREKKEQGELIKQVNNGAISCINSNHIAILDQDKDKEFGLAEFGAVGLSECFAALHTFAKNLDFERLINCLSIGSYDYLGLSSPKIEEGAKAILTLFDTEESYVVNANDSKVQNNPFLGQELKGKVIGIINGKKSITLV